MGNNTDDQPASSISGNAKEKEKKAAAFSLSQDPVIGASTEGAIHKYEAAPVQEYPQEAPVSPVYEDLGTLPATYNEDTLFVVARDPRWLFSYWDFNWTQYPAPLHRYNVAQFFLRIRSESGGDEVTVEVKPEARNWYVPVDLPDTEYIADIGFFEKGGAWHSIAKSAPARTPAEALAEDAAAHFATVPAHLAFERLLELVADHMREGETLLEAVSRITGEGREIAFAAGTAPNWTESQRALLAALLGNSLVDRIGLGSEEIDQLLRKQLTEKLQSESASELAAKFYERGGGAGGESSLFSGALFSGVTSWGASWSAQPFSVRRERGFFMHVNAEIVFYGGTHPDATVWIEGKPIKLSPDGTFRYHFTLPDGDFVIPIVAESPDKVEQRSATLSFTRGTARAGDVGSTGQPAQLSPLIGKK
ncbi:MAG: Rho termination factor, N-terminal domain protein [Chthoniobacteraceae bacterium]|nr:Rho termination factor, N-terminal domain protein [Chthoniobacteraceae bacterium]